MCNNNRDCDNCIVEILKVINVLQSNACPDNCLQSCDRPALGGGPNCIVCNTRPIMLYTCSGNGTPLSMPISRASAEGTTSNVFRVEKVDGCCCTCRLLDSSTDTYTSTNNFVTIDLKCCGSIRCLSDTFIDLC